MIHSSRQPDRKLLRRFYQAWGAFWKWVVRHWIWFLLLWLACAFGYIFYTTVVPPRTDSSEYLIVWTNEGHPPLKMRIVYPHRVPIFQEGEDTLTIHIWTTSLTGTLSVSNSIQAEHCITRGDPTVAFSGTHPAIVIWSGGETLRIETQEGKEIPFIAIDLSQASNAKTQLDLTYFVHFMQPSEISLFSLSALFKTFRPTLCLELAGEDGVLIPLSSQHDVCTSCSLTLSTRLVLCAVLLQAIDLLFRQTCLIPTTILIAISKPLIEWRQSWLERREQEREQRKRRLESRVNELIRNEETVSWNELRELRVSASREKMSYLSFQVDEYIKKQIRHGMAPWLPEMRKWLYQQLKASVVSKEDRDLLDLLTDLLTEDYGNFGLLQQTWRRLLQPASENPKSESSGKHQEERESKEESPEKIIALVSLLGLDTVREIAEHHSKEGLPLWVASLSGSPSPIARYLLYLLKEEEQARNSYRATHDNLRGPCRVWQKTHIADEHNPFGPLKAEDDPRLVRKKGPLFWSEHPQREEIEEEKDGLYLFPPGGGLSAFLLRARYEYAPYGTSPSLSVYLSLEHPVSEEAWLHYLHMAIVESLLCALVADPVWLLIDPSREILSLLQHYLQERQISFADALHLRGMDVQHGAGRLLMELFVSQSTEYSPIPLSWALLYAAVDAALRRLTLYVDPHAEKLPLFFWIEVPEAGQGFETLKWIAEERHLRDLGIIKLFSQRSNLTDALVEVWNDTFHLPLMEIEWSFEHLLAMAKWRLQMQAGVFERLLKVAAQLQQQAKNQTKANGQDQEDKGNESDFRKLLKLLEEDFEEWVRERGMELTTPREMVRAGNAWWQERHREGA